jgi:hypothetical protein
MNALFFIITVSMDMDYKWSVSGGKQRNKNLTACNLKHNNAPVFTTDDMVV